MQKLKMVEINVQLSNQDNLSVEITAISEADCLWEINPAEAIEWGEAIIQIKEGFSYDYKLPEGFELMGSKKIIRRHQYKQSTTGTLSPGNFVGTLTIEVVSTRDESIVGAFDLEVRSVKADYRTDYRLMLEEITEKCTELIMRHTSPASQYFTAVPHTSSKIIYQRFSFIKSILDSEEFDRALNKILQSPVTVWKEKEIEKEAHKIKRLNSKQLRKLSISSTNPFIKLAAFHKIETVDAPENRFVKYALTEFLDICTLFYSKLDDARNHQKEVLRLMEKLQHYLSHHILKSIGPLHTLILNSPVLQRKEGYRELLRSWLMCDLAAQLTWRGGEDVYDAGKKDVATLYEYWIFFKLIDSTINIFQLETPNIETLIASTANGLELKLKQGSFIAVKGIFNSPTRKFNVQLSYNRTFKKEQPYPKSGSWTTSLRPDFTLSLWPYHLENEAAEREELIVHIHFDAKYRIEHLQDNPNSHPDLNEEKDDPDIKKYKKVDLLKMHTYRDAIRRTAGAYVLYPGGKIESFRGFHEILPGLGAFSIFPSKSNNGIQQLEQFLKDVVTILLNRTSQRERMASKTFEIYKEAPSFALNMSLPEPTGINRALIPEDTYVLVGYYKNEEHLKWILSSNLYNTRINSKKGPMYLNPFITSAKYLLLHNKEEKISTKFFKLKTKGPKVFSKQDLQKKKYPTPPSQDLYLVFEIDPNIETDFKEYSWNVTRLKGFKSGKGYALPFAISLAEVMSIICPTNDANK
ncbi:MAG: DUF2357 domain-containing protein [Chitinophaga sp.]|uniref:DUF2357 domain-containing protein n=1 Tax=Chitinophaga sp. TaxID=1869181 RepID=UPI001B0E9EFE|nr:DUF2357 domain-containing protein [Chitinophaga sp.]MBO9728984.1 DUF2357 domain-containing protein [Chitinophaga sp.]